jgi:DNA polymerase III delta prime subunit
MGGRRTTKEELTQLEVLTKEGLTCREIAQRLARSPAAIRNLRYKKSLVKKAEDETKFLFRQRDELSNVVRNLQATKTTLAYQVDGLEKEKEKLEAFINVDKLLLQQTLSQALSTLKQQRPDLFVLTQQDQMASLIRFFFNNIISDQFEKKLFTHPQGDDRLFLACTSEANSG